MRMVALAPSAPATRPAKPLETTNQKRNPAVVLDRLGIAASEAIVVGDSPYDAQAAGKIGLRAIGVLCGGVPEADLRKAGCIAIYRDPADLLRCFDPSVLIRRVTPRRKIHSAMLAVGLTVA